MIKKNLFNILQESLIDFIKSPQIIIFPLVLLFILKIISNISMYINYKLQNTLALTLWLTFFSLLTLSILAFFFSGLIGLSKETSKRNFKLKHFFLYSKEFWFKNFQILIMISIITLILGRAAHYLALFIGKYLELSINVAAALFFFFYITALLGIIIFLTYSSFFLIIYNLKPLESMKKSIKFVKKEYLSTLIIILIFFILFFLLEKQEGIIFNLIEYLIITPYLSFVLTYFILNFNKK